MNTVIIPSIIPDMPPSTILLKSIPIPNENAKKGIKTALEFSKNCLNSLSRFPNIIPMIIGNNTDIKDIGENTPSTNPIVPNIAKDTIVKNGPSFKDNTEYDALYVLLL